MTSATSIATATGTHHGIHGSCRKVSDCGTGASMSIRCSTGRPHQSVRCGFTRTRARARPPGATCSPGGSICTSHAASVSAPASRAAAGALPRLETSIA